MHDVEWFVLCWRSFRVFVFSWFSSKNLLNLMFAREKCISLKLELGHAI